MSTKDKLRKLKAIRAEALRGRRELHSRRFHVLYAAEYIAYGKAVDMANAAIADLSDKLFVENL